MPSPKQKVYDHMPLDVQIHKLPAQAKVAPVIHYDTPGVSNDWVGKAGVRDYFIFDASLVNVVSLFDALSGAGALDSITGFEPGLDRIVFVNEAAAPAVVFVSESTDGSQVLFLQDGPASTNVSLIGAVNLVGVPTGDIPGFLHFSGNPFAA